MKRNLLISAILSLTITGAHAGINPFKPYMPLTEIDYAHNWSVGHDSTSIAYKPESLTQRALLPIGMLSTGILLNDNELDKRIKKEGKLSSTPLKSADFLQYSPAAILYILKIAGVQSRNDWPRMLTAHGTAAAIQFGLTQSIKNINDRERPDGHGINSFPSGHTATAFMCAQMLHREYGETVSPWISVAGYGLAATTGIFRVIANRHWCSDVMAGAAIGILSTELAYELTDILFGEHGIKRPVVVADIDETTRWKFGLYTEYSIGSDLFTSGGYGNPDARPASSIGIDASWMPWYIGPVIRAGLTQMKWTGADDLYLPDNGSVTDVYTIGAGLYMDIPLLSRLSINGQAIAGYSPSANSYSFKYQNQPLEWDIPAAMHCYANLGMTVRTSSFSSVSVHGGLDYYDKVWRSYIVGAQFNFTF
jgi:hypothetical protein